MHDIEAIGWQRVTAIGDRLTRVELQLTCGASPVCHPFSLALALIDNDRSDVDRRVHHVLIELPPTYPDAAPRVLVDMPVAFDVRWSGAQSSLAEQVRLCEAVTSLFVFLVACISSLSATRR